MLDLLKSKIGTGTIVKHISEAIAIVKPSKVLSIDIETFGESGLPGDSPYYENHGIAGISICGLNGDAIYIPTFGPDSIKLKDAIDYLNSFHMGYIDLLVGHNLKFDLGFLKHAGLMTPKTVRIRDTWIISSLRCQGVYRSNKLKDLVKAQFGIATEGKDEVEKYLTEHKSRDYADVPIEILGKYAADDVIFTLMILFNLQPALTEKELEIHDLLVRNFNHLNTAERIGIRVDVDKLKALLDTCGKSANAMKILLAQSMGATQYDPDEEQLFLKHLHSRNLHPGPRMYFGEMKYVFDREFLESCFESPVAKQYYWYHKYKAIIKQFSGANGVLGPRIFELNGEYGIHPSYYPSIFSRGGIAQCKTPDLANEVELENHIREVFKPTQGNKFVVVSSWYLQEMLLAFYAGDTDLENAIRSSYAPQQFMSAVTGLDEVSCKLLFRQAIEGSGNALLERRFKAEKLKGDALKAKDLFIFKLGDLKNLDTKINSVLQSEGSVKDRIGRVIQVPPDKRWRSLALLLASSYGSMIAWYMDAFCNLAAQFKAQLVFCHENEFVFEVDENDVEFEIAIKKFCEKEYIAPKPLFIVDSGKTWVGTENV